MVIKSEIKRKIAYVTNIPTPYRDFRFRLLSQLLEERGIQLDVMYMANTEKGRTWDYSLLRKGYSSKVYKNFGVRVGKEKFLYFNPGLLIDLKKNNYEKIIIGGVSSFTHVLASFIGTKDSRVLSIESNLDSIRHDNWVVNKIKSFILNQYDVFQVAGERSKDYVNKYKVLGENKFIVLRNIINEDDFKLSNKNDSFFPRDNKIRILCVSRLEEIKGVRQFLENVDSKLLENILIEVAGSGSQYEQISKLIEQRKLPVRLLGDVSSSKIKDYMVKSQFFLLPSKRDASPLSCIEAIYSGLPVLISDRVGNVNDVLAEGRNGYSFDVFDKDSINKVIAKVRGLNNSELQVMSICSKGIYRDKFDPKKQLNDYISKLEGARV